MSLNYILNDEKYAHYDTRNSPNKEDPWTESDGENAYIKGTKFITNEDLENNYKLEGFDGSYDEIYIFKGEYRYDNVIVCLNSNGSITESYVKRGNKWGKKVKVSNRGGAFLPLNTNGGVNTDFIMFAVRGNKSECRFYHIPTDTLSSGKTVSYDSVERTGIRNVFNIKGRDTQVEWTGGEFKVYEYEDTEADSGYNEDLRDVHSYPDLLDAVDNKVAIVNGREDAKKFLNGNLDRDDINVKERKINHIRDKYINDEITINVFEHKLENIMREYNSDLVQSNVESNSNSNNDDEEVEDELLAW